MALRHKGWVNEPDISELRSELIDAIFLGKKIGVYHDGIKMVTILTTDSIYRIRHTSAETPPMGWIDAADALEFVDKYADNDQS